LKADTAYPPNTPANASVMTTVLPASRMSMLTPTRRGPGPLAVEISHTAQPVRPVTAAPSVKVTGGG